MLEVPPLSVRGIIPTCPVPDEAPLRQVILGLSMHLFNNKSVGSVAFGPDLAALLLILAAPAKVARTSTRLRLFLPVFLKLFFGLVDSNLLFSRGWKRNGSLPRCHRGRWTSCSKAGLKDGRVESGSWLSPSVRSSEPSAVRRAFAWEAS